MFDEATRLDVELVLGMRVVSAKPVVGVCIAEAFCLQLSNGSRFFLKTGIPNSMLIAEANGLRALESCNCIRIPKVEGVGARFLLMEWIDQGKRPKHFFSDLGHRLALLHRCTSNVFGLDHDNFIGRNPQFNVAGDLAAKDWCTFYAQKRLVPQFNMVKDNGYANTEMEQLFDALLLKLPHILAGSDEPPSLLHGDLWSGNVMADAHGRPVFFDPAVYYGHREADLAMTKLFGGFEPAFYNAYQAEWPLAVGFEYREPVYMLYHVLNHLNLFGRSYQPQAMSILRLYQ